MVDLMEKLNEILGIELILYHNAIILNAIY